MKEKYIELNNNQIKILKIILTLSCPFLTLILCNRFRLSHILLSVCASFVVGILIFIKKSINNRINKKKLIIYIILSIYIIKSLLQYDSNNIILVNTIINKLFHFKIKTVFLEFIVGLCALPVTMYFVSVFLDKIGSKVLSFIKSLSKTEKRYLIIVFIISIIISFASIYFTTAFSKPVYDGNIVNYDVIYTSDSGALLKGNTYVNASFVENDIRQPLFGIFALPFGVIAHFVSNVLFLVDFNFSYELIMTIIQYMLVAITTIMLGQLLKIKEENKKYFYLLFMCSYTYLLFSLVLEQYVIGLFYLILAIYMHYKNPEKINYSYIGAVGTLITSGIIFPLITKIKNLKQWVKDVFKCFLAFCGVFIIGGQLPQIITGPEMLKYLLGNFAHKLTFMDKVYQFTHFIKGIFIANPGHLKVLKHIPGYQLYSYNSINIIGVAILVLCIVGFVINHKNKIARLSALWILFSVILLLIVGWGTVENGLVLYSLYFAWAYLILYYLLIEKLCLNKTIFKIIIICSCLIMLIFNISELINMFKFAIEYYGVI